MIQSDSLNNELRVDVSYSALFAAMEDTFISIGKGDGNGNLKETLYKMNKKEKDLLLSFLQVRNDGLLFNKTNVDPITGKATITDPDTGRPIDFKIILNLYMWGSN